MSGVETSTSYSLLGGGVRGTMEVSGMELPPGVSHLRFGFFIQHKRKN